MTEDTDSPVVAVGQSHGSLHVTSHTQDQLFLQDGSQVLDLAEISGTASYLMSLNIKIRKEIKMKYC